jgi:hypothetical protein
MRIARGVPPTLATRREAPGPSHLTLTVQPKTGATAGSISTQRVCLDGRSLVFFGGEAHAQINGGC